MSRKKESECSNCGSPIRMEALLINESGELSDHDLAVLSDYAGGRAKEQTLNPDWRKAYALIREGADLLLRRRARATVAADADMPRETDLCDLRDHEGAAPAKASSPVLPPRGGRIIAKPLK